MLIRVYLSVHIEEIIGHLENIHFLVETLIKWELAC